MSLAITSTTTEFVTLTEVKAQANISDTDTTNDAELDGFRLAAQEQVESIVGPVLWVTRSETRRVSGGVVLLRHFPVVSVQTVTSSGAAVTDYTLDGESGTLTAVTVSGDVVVDYTAGRTAAPESMRVAALIIAVHLWDTQRGNAPAGPAEFGTGEDTVTVPGIGYAIPRRAAELLAPYAQPAGVG